MIQFRLVIRLNCIYFGRTFDFWFKSLTQTCCSDSCPWVKIWLWTMVLERPGLSGRDWVLCWPWVHGLRPFAYPMWDVSSIEFLLLLATIDWVTRVRTRPGIVTLGFTHSIIVMNYNKVHTVINAYQCINSEYNPKTYHWRPKYCD